MFKFYPKFRSFIGLSLFLTSFSVFAGGEYVDGEIIVKLKSDQVIKGSTKAFSGMANKLGLSLKGSWKSMNLHHYKATSGSDVEALVKEIESDPAVEFAEPNYKFNLYKFGVQVKGFEHQRTSLRPVPINPTQDFRFKF